MKLTQNQEKVLAFCREHEAQNGAAPCTLDVSKHMGWSGTNRASDVMTSLVARGHLRVVDAARKPRPGASRQWELVPVGT